MIELIIKNLVENSNKIDSIVKYINTTNKRNSLIILLSTATICTVVGAIKIQEEKISLRLLTTESTCDIF